MFDEQTIRDQVNALRDRQLSKAGSDVYQTWADMAAEWLMNSPGEYIDNGFEGFNERSAEEIVEDFRLNNQLEEGGS